RLRVASLARRARSGPRRHRAALLESPDDSRSTPVTNASPPRGTRRTRRAIAVWWRVVVVALLLAAGCSREPAKSGAMTIAVIPKGTTHVFWQSIHAGAEKAAQELGVTIVWRGPLREDDRASQVSEVEGFVTRGVSGIVL